MTIQDLHTLTFNQAWQNVKGDFRSKSRRDVPARPLVSRTLKAYVDKT